MSDSALAPPLKWAGGKRWLAPKMAALWRDNPSSRLVEPFSGGLAIALGVAPHSALLNDANPHLINFYEQLSSGLDVRQTLLDGLDEHIVSRWSENIEPNLETSRKRLLGQKASNEQDVEQTIAAERERAHLTAEHHQAGTLENEKTYYYAAREVFNTLYAADQHLSPSGAVLFYYLNRTGFNGLCRFSATKILADGSIQRGRFNVPYGKYKVINYRYSFDEYRSLLSAWDFLCGDFSDLDTHSGDFLYADPPYDVDFTSYSEGGFSWDDQLRLVEWLDAFPGPVVLSNQGTERIISLYREHGYAIYLEDVARSISSKGSTRAPVQEVVAVRGAAVPQGLLTRQA